MSPCIDSGDPASPDDPDGTDADMGALYFDQNGMIFEDGFESGNTSPDRRRVLIDGLRPPP